jgi:hypothetical protein
VQKERQLAQLAYSKALDADRQARERMGDDLQAGRNLRVEDVRQLTHEHQLQLLEKGDDALRDMVEEARRKDQKYLLGDERTRDRDRDKDRDYRGDRDPDR